MPRKAAKSLLKHLLPPVAVSAARQLRAAVRPPTSGWFACDEGVGAFERPTNWNIDDIIRSYERRWAGFERIVSSAAPPIFASETEPAAFDPGTELFTADHLLRHNAILGLVFAVARAARQRKELSMLDWGGGVGHQYGLVRALLPELNLASTCFDLPVSVEFGARRFPEVRFTSDFACIEQKYDLVVANNSLQYFAQWDRVVDQLAAAANDFCFLTMLPVVLGGPSQVVTQRWTNLDGSTYSNPEWFLARDQVLRRFPTDTWKLQRELICGYSPHVHGSDVRVDYRGFLFERIG